VLSGRLGARAVLVGPHGEDGSRGGVELISLPKRRNRFWNILLAPAAASRARRIRADLYHVHDPVMIPAAFALKFLFRKTVVYDTREDFPAMMLTKSYLNRHFRQLFRVAVFLIERLGALCLDGFITADWGTLRPHARAGKSRKLVFYNLPNLEFFPGQIECEKRFELVYRGGLSERAGTFDLLEALDLLNSRNVRARLLMFGYADNDQALRSIRERLHALGLEGQVEMRGMIKHGEMARTLGQARISVSPLRAIPKFLNNIPVKMFESWACGLPVISTDLPPARPFFNHQQYGLLVKPGDPEDLARAIERLVRNPGEAERMGRAGRRAVLERFNNEPEVQKLVTFYHRVLAGRRVERVVGG
jgi:glycosyltransferase involved in cell wall biosynthesis